MINLTTPFEDINPQDYDEVITRLQKNIVTLKRLTDDALIGMSERREAEVDQLKAKIIGLQEENSAFRCANETLLKTSLNQEKENVDLKERLKNCLNHDSLLATRSELNKKDAAITELQEANKAMALESITNGAICKVKIANLQNSYKELKAELLKAAEFLAEDDYWLWAANRFKIIANKELDDE